MKTLSTLLTTALLAFGGTALTPTATAQQVNIEAVEKYWEMTSALRQNQPLTDETWNAFLEVPGNKLYVHGIMGEKDLKAYRKAIEVVYMPQHDSLLQTRLKAESWYYVLVNDYKINEEKQRQFLKEVSQGPGYLEQMYTLAYEYLPKRTHSKIEDLTLYYSAIGFDATARQKEIIFSVKAAMEFNQPKDGILEAHEVHHIIRPRKNFGEASEADKGIMWALASMQNEGIPDLIDKKITIDAGGPSGKYMEQWLLTSAPKAIEQLDTAIIVLSTNSNEAAHTVKYFVKIMQSSGGHIPGFFMANTIVRNGYQKQLIETADDPFAFINLYQKAAKKDKANAPMFSKASMAYLKKLEKKYTAIKPTTGETTTALAR